MTFVKISISLQKNLFQQVKHLADAMNISQSQLFVLAMESFIKRRENQKLLEAINQAYSDVPDEDEIHRLRNFSRTQGDMMKKIPLPRAKIPLTLAESENVLC
jgi:hypothetical protein